MQKLLNHKLFHINQNLVLKNGQDEVLILKKENKWMLPGGRLEKDEEWEQGLRREIKEETNIKDFSIKNISSVDISDSGNTYIIIFVGYIKNKKKIILSHEHIDYAWVKLDSLNKYDFWHKKIKDRIKIAFE